MSMVNTIIESMTGTNTLTDQVVASDLLFSSKSAITNISLAISETSSPEIRNVLRKQLDDAIDSHQKISSLMMNKGWYHAQNIDEQIKLDLKNAEAALNLPE